MVKWIPSIYPLYVSINIPAPLGSVMGIQRWLGSPFKHRHFNGKVIELQWRILQPSSHFRFLVSPGEKHQKGGDETTQDGALGDPRFKHVQLQCYWSIPYL